MSLCSSNIQLHGEGKISYRIHTNHSIPVVISAHCNSTLVVYQAANRAHIKLWKEYSKNNSYIVIYDSLFLFYFIALSNYLNFKYLHYLWKFSIG